MEVLPYAAVFRGFSLYSQTEYPNEQGDGKHRKNVPGKKGSSTFSYMRPRFHGLERLSEKRCIP